MKRNKWNKWNTNRTREGKNGNKRGKNTQTERIQARDRGKAGEIDKDEEHDMKPFLASGFYGTFI